MAPRMQGQVLGPEEIAGKAPSGTIGGYPNGEMMAAN
jgi:hypothetical protein